MCWDAGKEAVVGEGDLSSRKKGKITLDFSFKVRVV